MCDLYQEKYSSKKVIVAMKSELELGSVRRDLKIVLFVSEVEEHLGG